MIIEEWSLLMFTIQPLKITFEYDQRPYTVYPTVIQENKTIILVDLGYPGFLPLIEEALEAVGIPPKKVTHLFLTHHDDQHMGAAFEWKKKYRKVKIIASEVETPYIEGKIDSVKLQRAKEMLASVPEKHLDIAEGYIEALSSIRPVSVDIQVTGESRLPIQHPHEILETPGFTPGHLSLYFPEEKIIVAGNAAAIEKRQVTLAEMDQCLDLKQAADSLERLIQKDPNEIICFHGGVFKK